MDLARGNVLNGWPGHRLVIRVLFLHENKNTLNVMTQYSQPASQHFGQQG